MATKKQICVEFAFASKEMYRDYFNNFLSITAFADYYGISDTMAKAVISVGREQHELSAEEKK